MRQDPGGVPPRIGLRGFVDLYAESLGRIRSSAHLRTSLLAWVVTGLLLTEAYSVGVAQLVSTRAALLAALAATGWWLFVALVLAGGAPLLVTPSGQRVDYYGWPNGLTALRAWSCLPLLLCAALPLTDDLGLILWCCIGAPAGLLDAVDGWIARRFGPLTMLGKALDPAMDALFFSVAAVGNQLLGIIPTWLMALLLLRFLAPLLATPIVFLARRRPELGRTEWGRRNTLLTGVVLFTCMWVRIFHGPVSAVALALGIPLLVTTTALHFVALGQRAQVAPVVRLRKDRA